MQSAATLCRTLFRGPLTLQSGVITSRVSAVIFPYPMVHVNKTAVAAGISPPLSTTHVQDCPFEYDHPHLKILPELTVTTEIIRRLTLDLLSFSGTGNPAKPHILPIPMKITSSQLHTRYQAIVSSNGFAVTGSLIPESSDSTAVHSTIMHDDLRLQARTAVLTHLKLVMEFPLKSLINEFIQLIPDNHYPAEIGLDLAYTAILVLINDISDQELGRLAHFIRLLKIESQNASTSNQTLLRDPIYHIFCRLMGEEWPDCLTITMRAIFVSLLIEPTKDVNLREAMLEVCRKALPSFLKQEGAK